MFIVHSETANALDGACSNNIAQIAHLVAEKHGARSIVFAGGMLSHPDVLWHYMAFAQARPCRAPGTNHPKAGDNIPLQGATVSLGTRFKTKNVLNSNKKHRVEHMGAYHGFRAPIAPHK